MTRKRLMTRAVDHIIWAHSDLDEAIALLHAMTGVAAMPGGVHPGRGTRNALISLGPSCYLEILAPDPAQPLDGTFGASLLDLSEPQIIGVMLASSDLDGVKAVYADYGVDCNGPFQAERKTTEGSKLRWRLLIPVNSPWGNVSPMLIDWGQTPNPALSAPSGGRLERFEIGHPDGDRLKRFCADIDADIHVVTTELPWSSATLEGHAGQAVITGSRPDIGL